MAGYRPRPTEMRACVHCGTHYETRHARTIYCSSSCRTLAYYDRVGASTEDAKPKGGELDVTFKNVGVVALGSAVGSGVVATVNHLASDRPAQRKAEKQMDELRQELAALKQLVMQGNIALIQAVNAKNIDPAPQPPKLAGPLQIKHILA